MVRISFTFRVKSALVRHPLLANRLMRMLGARGVERLARRSAIRAAQKAYRQVPFYQSLFTRSGFTARQMRRLNWKGFQQLPISDKVQAMGVADRDLMDNRRSSPDADAIIGRSSGTTAGPAFWPAGWEELTLARAAYWRWLREIGADRTRTAVVVSMTVDGYDLAGNLTLFSVFSLKEQTHWPYQTFAAGENPEDVIILARWLTEQSYETLFLLGFPGAIERLLDLNLELEQANPGSGVDWSRFNRIRVAMGGQVVSPVLRKRIRQEMGISIFDLMFIYSSSDIGQVLFQSSPFTLWLESLLEAHPELGAKLGISEEDQGKPIMECITALAVYSEIAPDGTLVVTTWKHRPLVRYQTHDLLWVQSTRDIIRTLNREVKGWRKDFARAGFGRRFIPRVATLGTIQGRDDDVCIVNACNITPDLLRSALEESAILSRLHHFKHSTNPAYPTRYSVYLELDQPASADELCELTKLWSPQLLQALLTRPGLPDLAASHRANPIDFQLILRSRGEAEFATDDHYPKKRYMQREGQISEDMTATP